LASPEPAPPAPAGTPAVRRLRRGWFLAGLALVAAVLWLSLVPLPSPPVAHADKVEHLGTYGALMLWFAQLGGQARRRAVTAAALVALGVGIEFLQDLTPYRMMDPLDMLANAAGVALGWLGAPPRTPNVLDRITRRFAAA
jgi:VanZ family protein